MRIILCSWVLFAMIFPSIAKVDQSPALEGGKGFIQTQTAGLYGAGYLGTGLTGIYTSVKLENASGKEQLFIGSVNLTYDLSDELEFSGNLYLMGQARQYGESGQLDQFRSGFGKGILAAKYRFPFTGEQLQLGTRVSLHVPMGANFMIYPSYPFDTDNYGLELALLQSISFNQSFRLHLNEGLRWQGLQEESRYSEDLLLLSATADYNLSRDWFGFSEISSLIELDDKVEPFERSIGFKPGHSICDALEYGFQPRCESWAFRRPQ